MHFLPKASYGTLEREREREGWGGGVGVVGELCSECVSSGTKDVVVVECVPEKRHHNSALGSFVLTEQP